MFFQDKIPHTTDWINFLVIGIFFALGLLHFANSFSLKNIFSGINSVEIHSGKSDFKLILLNIIFLLIIALLALFFVRKDQLIHPEDWLLYLKLILGIGLLLVAQRLATLAHAFLTKSQDFFTQYAHLRSNFFQLSASIMLPFLLLAIYSPAFNGVLILISVAVFILVYSLGVLKTLGFSNILAGQFRYHIFFYICGIEILPLFILYKQLI